MTIGIAVAAALGLSGAPAPAAAGESYDNCTGFIETLPATIGSQGNWCLKGDVATGMTSGNAIEVVANNVTIDCNDFKISGAAAGPGSLARGVRVIEAKNVTVRQCGIHGFHVGIHIDGGKGHLIENNRIDSNLASGVNIASEGADSGTVVRNNLILNTGGNAFGVLSLGVDVDGHDIDISGNIIRGSAVGIQYQGGNGSRIAGNRVSAVQTGIIVADETNDYAVVDNIIQGPGSQGSGSTGIACSDVPGVIRSNVILGFDKAVSGSCPSTDPSSNEI